MQIRKPFILCCTSLIFACVFVFVTPSQLVAQETEEPGATDSSEDAAESNEALDDEDFPSLDDLFGDDEWDDDGQDNGETPAGYGSLDDLFASPDVDLEALPEAGDVVDLATIGTDERPQVSGRVRSRGGVTGGLRDNHTWADFQQDPLDSIGVVGLFDMDMLVSMDYRPTAYQRLFASVRTATDHKTLEFSTPAIDELFVDYIYHDDYFFRAGRQSLTWGQARLLQNEANFVSRFKQGMGLRAFAPWRSGATSVIYTTEKYVNDAESRGPQSFGYAGLFETAVGRRNSVGVSSYYRYEQPLRAAAYLTTSYGVFDLALEGVSEWNVHAYDETGRRDDLEPRFIGLVSSFWENTGSPRVRLIAEYQFDSEIEEYKGHRVALGSRLSRLSWTRWALNMRWRHEFSSGSGDALIGFEGPLARGITAAIGMPVFYQDPDFVEPTEEEEYLDEFTVSALLTLSMTISF